MAVKVMRMSSSPISLETNTSLPQPVATLRRPSADHSIVSALNIQQSFGYETSRAASRSLPAASPPVATDPQLVPASPAVAPVSRPTTPISSTEDIEELVDQLDRTNIQTAAPSTSKIIEVPKGYELGMAFNISTFYDLRSDFRKLDKRKRDLGIIPKSTRGQKHGFRPEELLWYGAIDLKDCKPSNLTNEIHPLLCRDSFDDTPDNVYDQLAPGLRLATFFLSHPACMQFWVTLAKGERRVDHEMSRRCGKTRHRISRNVPMTEQNVGEVIEYMKNLGTAKTIHFTFTPGLAFGGDAAFGIARTICDYQSEGSDSRQFGGLQCSNVRLHSDFYIIAKKLSTMKYPDPAQKLRFNFIFATLIVHELAHAIELSQWRNRAPSPYEPFLLHHNEAELGRMWESYVFGGQIAPINDRVDGIYGVATWNWPRSFGEMDPERTICHALPMKYIENLQQTTTWEHDYDLKDWRVFHIPRDGATSIYMNSVTTVSWTEEERAAKEALQERQLQDLEEPAQKKRETADGHAVAIKNVSSGFEVVESEISQEDQGTTAQQVQRVKRQPRSALSRRQRRAQKKLAQKASEKTQASQEQASDAPDVTEKDKTEEIRQEDESSTTTTTSEAIKADEVTNINESTNDDVKIEAENA
ncbi:MAG: hypothetical protein Q9216_002039 [Gyalolechia sp. 2 TL-2023]